MPLAAALPYIIGGATVASGVYGANQAKKASNAQIEAGNAASALEQQSADKQLELQREIWEKQQADYKPYLEQGTWGINRLGDLMRNQSAVSQSQQPTQTGGVLSNLNNVNWNKGNGFTSAPAKTLASMSDVNWGNGFGSAAPLGFGLNGTNILGDGTATASQPVNPLIPNYDVMNTVPDFSRPITQQPKTQVQIQPPPQTQYQNNANGGFLNNPFDSYLASKGVTDNFDSYLKSKGVSDNFDSYLKSKGVTDNFDSYLKSKGLAGGQFDTNNPAYQFQLKQGQQALDRQNAARGAGFSGSQMKAAQQFGQGLASQEYDKQYTRANEAFTNDYNRASGQFTNNYNRANDAFTNDYNRASGQFTDYYNRLAGLSQGGQQAAGSMANAGNQYATGSGNTLGNLSNAQASILGQQANARASGYAANANALNGTLNSLTNLYGMSKWGK